MKVQLTACVISCCLAGCNLFSSLPPPDPRSGLQLSAQRVTVTGDLTSFDIKKELKVDPSDSQFYELFSSIDACGTPIKPPSGTLAADAAIAILIALSSALIELGKEWGEVKMPERQKMAGRDSGAKVVMSAELFKTARCIVFARWAAGDSLQKPGLIVVLKIERPAENKPKMPVVSEVRGPDYFTVRPVFVRASNSISVTKKGEPISVVIAVALQQIVDVDGVPALVDIGASTTKVSDVKLSGDILCQRKDGKDEKLPCSESTIHPLPNKHGTVVVGVGIQEVGELGFEVDMANAELGAIAAALGPLSGQLIKGHYDREKVRRDAR